MSIRDFLNDPALLVSVEAALNLSYGIDPSIDRPDINEVIGGALNVVISDIRDTADWHAAMRGPLDDPAKAAVLERLADWLEAWIVPEGADHG